MTAPADGGRTGAPIDGVLFDLDGVVYHGPDAVPGAVEAIAALHDRGIPVGYVTNNATRTADTVAEHIGDLGIATTPAEVITSAQVLAARLAEEYGRGARILLLGTTGLAEALRGEGLAIVDSLDDSPVALAQGLDPTIDYAGIVRAAEAITSGLDWWATNPDLSMVGRASRVPGNGAFIAMLSDLTDREPRIVGKPSPDVMTHAAARLGSSRPLMIGDRLDTDIEGGNRAGVDTALVLTGVHDLHDALNAEAIRRPTFILPTLSDLPRLLDTTGRSAVHSAETTSPNRDSDHATDHPPNGGRGGGHAPRIVDGALALDEAARTDATAIEAALRTAWQLIDAGESIEPGNLPRRIDA